jgi:hypothetical protein
MAKSNKPYIRGKTQHVHVVLCQPRCVTKIGYIIDFDAILLAELDKLGVCLDKKITDYPSSIKRPEGVLRHERLRLLFDSHPYFAKVKAGLDLAATATRDLYHCGNPFNVSTAINYYSTYHIDQLRTKYAQEYIVHLLHKETQDGRARQIFFAPLPAAYYHKSEDYGLPVKMRVCKSKWADTGEYRAGYAHSDDCQLPYLAKRRRHLIYEVNRPELSRYESVMVLADDCITVEDYERRESVLQVMASAALPA